MAKYKKLNDAEWGEIRLNYVTRVDEPSLRDLAKEFKIPLSTLAKRASESGWSQKRKKYQNTILQKAEGQLGREVINRIRKKRVEYVEWMDSIITRSMNRITSRIKGDEDTKVLDFDIFEIGDLMKLRQKLAGKDAQATTNIGKLIVNMDKPVEEMTGKERNKLKDDLKKVSNGKIEEAEIIEVQND